MLPWASESTTRKTSWKRGPGLMLRGLQCQDHQRLESFSVPPRPQPRRAFLRAKARRVTQFCRQNMEERPNRHGPGPAPARPEPHRFRPWPGLHPGPSPAPRVWTAAPAAAWSHTVETAGPPPPPLPGTRITALPLSPGLGERLPPVALAPGSGCVGSEASISPAERPGLGRCLLPLGPKSWALGRWRRRC